MRLRQIAIINGIFVIAFISFFIITKMLLISFTQLFIILGVITFLQAIVSYIKRESTRSLVPTFEKVSIYEKEKLGQEWVKQRKVAYIWNLILSIIIFFQAYSWNHSLIEEPIQIDFLFMFIILVYFLFMLNIVMFIHFRKIDRSTSELELKGFTRKFNLLSIVIGIVFSMGMTILIVFYIFSQI